MARTPTTGAIPPTYSVNLAYTTTSGGDIFSMLVLLRFLPEALDAPAHLTTLPRAWKARRIKSTPSQHVTYLLSNSMPSAPPRSRLCVPSTSTSTNGVGGDAPATPLAAAPFAARLAPFLALLLPDTTVDDEEEEETEEEEAGRLFPPSLSVVAPIAAVPASALLFFARTLERAEAAAAVDVLVGRFLLLLLLLLLPLPLPLPLPPPPLLLFRAAFSVMLLAVGDLSFFAMLFRLGREQSCRSTQAPTVVLPGSVSSACSRTGNLCAYRTSYVQHMRWQYNSLSLRGGQRHYCCRRIICSSSDKRGVRWGVTDSSAARARGTGAWLDGNQQRL